MLPRRSLRIRLRQLNGQTASHSIASSETSKSFAQTAKKRARTESSSDDDNEGNQPKQKKTKLFKHNLESFPTEILEEIFMRTDDVGLLNLANTCTRFEAIAQTVFLQRYADKFFSINGECRGGDPEIYAAIFDCFGSHIKAIQLNHFNEDKTTAHWALKIIQSLRNQIEKLTYNKCTFKSNHILSQPLKIATHLVFRDVDVPRRKKFDLPKCRNLVELEIVGTSDYTFQSLKQTICDNSGLQRVILKDFYDSSYHKEYFSIINLIANQLTDIKELVLYDKNYEYWHSILLASDIDTIVESFKHLESLTINSDDDDMLELLQRWARECKSLKHLGLFEYDDEVAGESFPSFEQVQSLHLMSYSHRFIPIDLPVEHFPNLRHLTIQIYDYDKVRFSNLLPLVHQCQSLQSITIIPEDWEPVDPQDLITVAFFEKFIETTIVAGKPNFQIDVADNVGDVGSVTVNGVVWRNKLMCWMDCSRNDTNIHLLDLASHPMQSDATRKTAEHTNLLDRIFDYLDLESLDAVAEIDERSKQLVNSYVEEHAKGQKSFSITDEFHEFEHDLKIFDRLKGLRLIIDLNVFCLYDFCSYSIKKFVEKCELLNELSIFDKGYRELTNIVQSFQKVETIECKNAGLFSDLKSVESNTNKFGRLKKFTFNYRGETQMKNLKKIFENTTVQLIPIHQNSA